jgi:hypothetical protein
MAHKSKKRPASLKRKNDKWKTGKPADMTKTKWARVKRKKKADKKQKDLQKKGKKGHTYRSKILEKSLD